MSTRKIWFSFAMLTMVLAIGATDCQEQFPDPPFDTTGEFTGTWSGNSTDQAQNVVACPIELMLTQNVAANYPGDHAVNGTAIIDYSCIELPDWVETPAPSVVNVSGILGGDGALGLLSGGCGTGLCVVLGLSGQGEDTDDDGLMDTYNGTWSYQILLAGVEPFGFNGVFEFTIPAP